VAVVGAPLALLGSEAAPVVAHHEPCRARLGMVTSTRTESAFEWARTLRSASRATR